MQQEEEDQLINPRNTKLHLHAIPPLLPTHLPKTFHKYATSIGNRKCFVMGLTLKIFISAIKISCTLSRNLSNVQASMRFRFSLRLLWLVTSSGNVYEYMAAVTYSRLRLFSNWYYLETVNLKMAINIIAASPSNHADNEKGQYDMITIHYFSRKNSQFVQERTQTNI